MAVNRIFRLNSLLKEVISEVVKNDVGNPQVSSLITITKVEVSKDVHHARVYVSVIGTDEDKQKNLHALQSAAGYIAVLSSKKVVLRHFPALTFKLDDSVDYQMRIDTLLKDIDAEKKSRSTKEEEEDL